MVIEKGDFKMIKKLMTICLVFAWFSISVAGTSASIGTDSGNQLLIPTGAKGVALNSSYNASVSGVDALYYNPAGIAGKVNGVEAQFSSYSYIAGIKHIYAAFVSNVGEGTVGLSFKSLDFGDIKKTTADDTHGTSGNSYSPNFSVLTLSYAKSFSDRIRFGTSFKVVNESVDQTGGTAYALDMGVQYEHAALPLKLGVSLRNLGSKLEYSGIDLEDGTSTLLSEASNLPANLNISSTYKLGPVDIHYSFTNQSYAFNESALGLEYQIEMGDFSAWVGGGINTLLIEEDDLDEDYSNNPFGISFGGGLNAKLGDFNFGLDLGLKQSELFGNTSVLAFNIGF